MLQRSPAEQPSKAFVDRGIGVRVEQTGPFRGGEKEITTPLPTESGLSALVSATLPLRCRSWIRKSIYIYIDTRDSTTVRAAFNIACFNVPADPSHNPGSLASNYQQHYQQQHAKIAGLGNRLGMSSADAQRLKFISMKNQIDNCKAMSE